MQQLRGSGCTRRTGQGAASNRPTCPPPHAPRHARLARSLEPVTTASRPVQSYWAAQCSGALAAGLIGWGRFGTQTGSPGSVLHLERNQTELVRGGGLRHIEAGRHALEMTDSAALPPSVAAQATVYAVIGEMLFSCLLVFYVFL